MEFITTKILLIMLLLIFMTGVFTGYTMRNKLSGKEFITFSVVFMWLFLVPSAFIFDKEIPGYFDIVAGMVVTFYLGIATEKGAEALKLLTNLKGKK